ncbi:hypothetical protein B0I35DRAFT_204285 [Stachybotrys elegans]|uniref:HSF-type DNA-binding domain-containing protein n=1 Tax=Stachybotrys elegans TaxID=80388 RepID=A0A8K0SU63_9HYPO|nr:hypothetical protein B0I35DRAFT_204285 [Stachybotrys elegans]
MSGAASRKRAAPGTSPTTPIQPTMQQPYGPANMSNDQLMRWNGAGDVTGRLDATHLGPNPYALAQPQPAYAQAIDTPSNSLTRREPNRALVQTNPRSAFVDGADTWAGFNEDGSLLPQNLGENLNGPDDINALEELAQKAKREAQGKRKQIPPFVQKLSSFLEERKNEDLIRWSEKGDSFIVLDEDEFAKTLIPELFKHNKYASFVRQLNMYGFHKKVGLSDNSMRASERKNKSPSEYFNRFFRRGHPNLLWLINKPSGGNKGKKGGKNPEGEADSDDEIGPEETLGPGLVTPNVPTARSLPAADSQPLQKKEMALIREELKSLRDQQRLILGAINNLQRNNRELYNQAIMFQSQHDRHQNSINAILMFLANVFRKTLDDQGNTQSVSDIISSLITNPAQGQGPHSGNVVDLGDFFQASLDNAGQTMGSAHKRTRGLLGPIPSQEPTTPSGRSKTLNNGNFHIPMNQGHKIGQVTELLDPSPSETPPTLRQELENNPHERMMKIINDHNATRTSGLDLPEAAEIVNKAPNTLNQDQRSQLVNLMASQPTTSASPTPSSGATSVPQGMPSVPSTSAISPPAETVPSLSPIMRSPQMVPPSLSQINANQIDLTELQRLQSEQDAKISELGEMLGPLSPNGRIPAMQNDNAYFDANNVDLDQFFDSDAFLQDGAFPEGVPDFNFDLADGGQDVLHPTTGQGGSRHDTPSPAGTEEIQRNDLGYNETLDRGTKRRRMD